jgi:anti-sigma-K factor RskA
MDERDYDSLLLLLSRRIKNLTGDQMWLRRLVQDWQKRISRMDQTQAMTRILQTVRRPINTDLYMALQSSSKVTPTNT